jgi:anaerobic magnesium-protoporphyrin IX monomethyl ester cyclase
MEKTRRSARSVTLPGPADESGTAPLNALGRSVLLVDLNNFATFPTLAIGLLVASLRNAGHQVELLSPLAYDVPAGVRERRESWRDGVVHRLHMTTFAPLQGVRGASRAVYRRNRDRPNPTTMKEMAAALERGPDVVLLSAYLQHHPTVEKISRMAKRAGVPVVLGGPMFNVQGVAETWRKIPGLAAVVGAESDQSISDLVNAVCEGDDLTQFPGVVLPDGTRSGVAPPLRNLDASPMADYTDFPWDRYPVRIVPMMTGRGCQHDKCSFCSDVISTNGRSFRTRSVESVLVEMREQAQRHGTKNFLFLDLKLNSWPKMLRGLAEEAQRYVPGAQWIGTVHVDLRDDNGLSRADLKTAVAGGMRRVSFGLESGSQPLLDAMNKGCSVERNGQFIREAHEAGLSVRCTMFKGFPGETPADLIATAEFLEEHSRYLDRVRFNQFSIIEDTPIYEAMRGDELQQRMRVWRIDPQQGRAWADLAESGRRDYRKALKRTLAAVHAINRREVRESARQFDGLM